MKFPETLIAYTSPIETIIFKEILKDNDFEVGRQLTLMMAYLMEFAQQNINSVPYV